MRTIKKIIKKTIGVLFLVLLIIGGVIGYKGYERYKEVLEKVPLQEKIAEDPAEALLYGNRRSAADLSRCGRGCGRQKVLPSSGHRSDVYRAGGPE